MYDESNSSRFHTEQRQITNFLRPSAYHVNFGGGVVSGAPGSFYDFGLHSKAARITPKLRLVGEINGGNLAEARQLIRAVGLHLASAVARRISIRRAWRGISHTAPDWIFTTGLTFTCTRFQLIWQMQPFWQCIQILARSIFRPTDDAYRRIAERRFEIIEVG